MILWMPLLMMTNIGLQYLTIPLCMMFTQCIIPIISMIFLSHELQNLITGMHISLWVTQLFVYWLNLSFMNALSITSILVISMRPCIPSILRSPRLLWLTMTSKCPYFGWLSNEMMKRIFKHFTQNMCMPPSTYLQKCFKSPNPGANIFHCCKHNATDIIYSHTPSVCGGETKANIFVWLISCVTNVYKEKKLYLECFLGSLQDCLPTCCAPTKLISGNASLYRGLSIICYLCDILTSLWQCETIHQHQNYVENRYKMVNWMTNHMMDWFGCPTCIWFLCLVCVCFILNHSVDVNIGDDTMTPLIMSCYENFLCSLFGNLSMSSQMKKNNLFM